VVDARRCGVVDHPHQRAASSPARVHHLPRVDPLKCEFLLDPEPIAPVRRHPVCVSVAQAPSAVRRVLALRRHLSPPSLLRVMSTTKLLLYIYRRAGGSALPRRARWGRWGTKPAIEGTPG